MNKNRRKTMNYLLSIGFDRKQVDSIIKKYGIKVGLDNPKDLNLVSDTIQGNWNDFMKFYISIQRQYKRYDKRTFKLF